MALVLWLTFLLYRNNALHAALDVNLPNYAAAIVSSDEIVASISSLEGFIAA